MIKKDNNNKFVNNDFDIALNSRNFSADNVGENFGKLNFLDCSNITRDSFDCKIQIASNIDLYYLKIAKIVADDYSDNTSRRTEFLKHRIVAWTRDKNEATFFTIKSKNILEANISNNHGINYITPNKNPHIFSTNEDDKDNTNTKICFKTYFETGETGIDMSCNDIKNIYNDSTLGNMNMSDIFKFMKPS